ncbi:MAG: hypothetical protein DGJ47_000833 [Rickettsiaceae bacterium]
MLQHTERLGLPLLNVNQSMKEIIHNESLNLLDILVHPIIEKMFVTKPPANAKTGQLYVIAKNPESIFKDHPFELALKRHRGWHFTKPLKWMHVSMNEDGKQYIWSGHHWYESEERLIAVNDNTIIAGNLPKDVTSRDITPRTSETKAESVQATRQERANTDDYVERSKEFLKQGVEFREAVKRVSLTETDGKIIEENSGEYFQIARLEECVSLEGNRVSTNIAIPTHSMILAVNIRVKEKIKATGFNVGVSDDLKRYGQNLKAAVDTTNVGLTNHPTTYWQRTHIILTPRGSTPFKGGKVIVNVHYMKSHGPWDWD